jgi:mono/diheme cytochrome c family protein
MNSSRRVRVACKTIAMAMALLLVVALWQPAGSTLAAEPAATAPGTGGVAAGEQVYARWCVHCHASGRGMPGTQSLQVKYNGRVPAVLLERTDLAAEAVAVFVRQGVQSMPPFRKTEISDAELAVLAAWVASGGGKR